MRILQLTPGTGNFYCGSCLRDNALVNALRARGHEVLMVPLYLPLLTDEPSACDAVPVFFGGINVYLQRLLCIPKSVPRLVSGKVRVNYQQKHLLPVTCRPRGRRTPV